MFKLRACIFLNLSYHIGFLDRVYATLKIFCLEKITET